ncbi:thermonuclease family protein [Aliihoeflea aestuarii]|uniref:thermonuclease family protein n=1 Tax=Aliihoeflea aestuarii TaxID=453840 RepID=UPI00209279A4|nr:thermonuclease family protein [Aliihoeflea aestuarii]
MPGPVPASVVRVIDGDTVEADAHVWPGHTVRVSVRLRGIDAPELRSRCEAERVLAQKARAHLSALLQSGSVRVRNVARDKFFGRVVADLETDAGEDVAPLLLAADLARPYAGGRRASWCDDPN